MNEAPPAAPDGAADHRPLLRWGLVLLRRWSLARRYSHLYPEGPDPQTLFRAYQRWIQRQSLRPRTRPRSPRAQRRDFRRELRQRFEKDALARDRRVRWMIPPAEPGELDPELPPVVRSALQSIQGEDRKLVAAYITARPDEHSMSLTLGKRALQHEQKRLAKAMHALKDALTEHLLDQPQTLYTVHPQYLAFTQSALPSRYSDPWRSWILFRLPLQLIALVLLLLGAGYAYAYYRFNDKVLGRFLTENIGTVIDGELQFEYVHWSPRLLLDLMIGRAHTVQVKGVRVFEGFKYARRPGVRPPQKPPSRRVTAYAQHLEADLVLHEIVPWNRLGVPRVFNIPWILHFRDIRSFGRMWVGARAYHDPETGTDKISITDAFGSPDDSPSTLGYKRLSFAIDDTHLSLLEVPLDFLDDSEWGASLFLKQAHLRLSFEGDYPEAPERDELPFRYLVHAKEGYGSVVMLDERLTFDRIEDIELGSGYLSYPMGDFHANMYASVQGSQCHLDGVLLDSLEDDIGVDVSVQCKAPNGLFETVLPVEPGDTGPILHAEPHGHVALEIAGSLDDPLIEFHGEGIDLDPQLDPEYKVLDADFVASLRDLPVPDRLAPIYGQDRAKAGHWTFEFERFSGKFLGGTIEAVQGGSTLVLPEHAEPFSFFGDFKLKDLQLSKAPASVPKIYSQAEARLDVQELVFGEALDAAGPKPPAIPLSERFGGLWPTFVPPQGPRPDTSSPEVPMTLQTLRLEVPRLAMRQPLAPQPLPRTLEVDGQLVWREQEGISIEDTRITAPGAQLLVDLAADPEFGKLQSAKLELDIDDGDAFFPAFGLTSFAQTLRTELEFSGPLHRLSGPPGRLFAPALHVAGLDLRGLDRATLQWRQGALVLDAPRLEVLGGHGPLTAELWPRLGQSKAPALRAKLDLRDLAQHELLGWPVSFEDAQLSFVVDDGKGGPRALDSLSARGHAFVPKLTMAKVRYHNARAAFVLDQDKIEIDELSLRYGRSVSPKLAPSLRVSTGFFAVRGHVGLSSDPELDLSVESAGLPLRALTNFADSSVPVRGRISQGTALRVQGRVSQPRVEGSVHLASVNAANLSLGRGQLEFSSLKRSQGRGSSRLSIREVRVQGDLHPEKQRTRGLSVDATLAVGKNRRGQEFTEVMGVGSISTIPLHQLLALPHQGRWRRKISGQLRDLSIEASYCPSAQTMLSACKDRQTQRQGIKSAKELKDSALTLDLRLQSGWAGLKQNPGAGKAGSGSGSCPSQATGCMLTPLHARLDEGQLHLQSPWRVATGPVRRRSEIELQGTFDLRPAPPGEQTQSCDDFKSRLSALSSSPRPAAFRTRGQIKGAVDLRGLDPLILPMGVGPMRGKVTVDLDMWGPLAAPWVEGKIGTGPSPLRWTLLNTENKNQEPISLWVPSLNVQVRGDVAKIESQVTALKGQLDVGTGQSGVSGIGLTGACRGRYAVSLGPKSRLDASFLGLLFPDDIEQSSGSIAIPRFALSGNWQSELRAGPPAIDDFSARLSFEESPIELSAADQDLRVTGGDIDLRLCRPGDSCAGPSNDQGIAINIGDTRRVSGDRPANAIGIQSDATGRTQHLWGQLTLPPNLSDLHFAELSVALDQYPYRQDDNAGRPELVANLSSDRLRLRVTPDGFRRISGRLRADKARWLRDAVQGVRSVVSFGDPVPAPPSTMPATLAQLELDLELKTTSPFRVDNNILRGLEANAELRLGGTLGEMEVTGPIEVQRGTLDLALLGGAYIIDQGRVHLNRRIADSEVRISATRQAPVRIDNELHQVTLDLDGPLDAIRWRCHSTAQRNRGLQTLRGCIDYLIFDAGDAALTPLVDVDSGSLNLTRRSLTLFGNLTQIELNRFVEDELPRTGEFLPIVRGRVRQLGLELQIQTREDWFSWRWGRLGLGYSYLRGYSGSFLRDSQSLSSKLHLLEDVALEMQLGLRNYSNVALVLQPPRFGSLELGHRIRIPGLR